MKKKILSIILLGCMMLTLTACGRTQELTKNEGSNLLSDIQTSKKDGINWSDLNITLNEKEISLPCYYDDFKEAGYTFNDWRLKEGSSLMLDTYRQHTRLDDKEGKITFEAWFCEPYLNNKKPIEECLIGRVEQSLAINNLSERIVFPGNLEIGTKTSIEELTKLFGKPTIANENEFVDSYAWYETGKIDICNYISVSLDKDGTINKIILDARYNVGEDFDLSKEWGMWNYLVTGDDVLQGIGLNFPHCEGLRDGTGRVGGQDDGSLSIFDAEHFIKSDGLALEDILPAYFEQAKDILQAFKGFEYTDFIFEVSEKEKISVNDYDMCKYVGKVSYVTRKETYEKTFIAYATRLKSNGLATYWMVIDETDDQSLYCAIEDYAYKMASTFKEVE